MGEGQVKTAQMRQPGERLDLERVEWIVTEIKMLQLGLASRKADLHYKVVTEVESLEAGG